MTDKCHWLFERNGKITVRWSPWFLWWMTMGCLVAGFALGFLIGFLWP